jgi:hypothetical protein
MTVSGPLALSHRLITSIMFALALFLSYDRRLHWDEATYLYLAAYYSPLQLLDHTNPYFTFYSSRLLYILLLSTILSPGATSLFISQASFAALLLVSIYLMCVIVRLLPSSDKPGYLTYSTFCTVPVVMWLCYKVVPEVVALFSASLSILCFTLAISGARRIWLVAAGVAAAATALTRNNLLIMLLSFWVASPFLYTDRAKRTQALLYAALVVLVAAFSLLSMMTILGISFADYAHTFVFIIGEQTQDLTAYAITLTLSLGLFWPIAFIGMVMAGERRYRIFSMLVFLLPTLISLALLKDLETRYLISNLLGVLVLTTITQKRLWEVSRFDIVTFGKVTLVGGAILLASGAFSQRILEHSVAVAPLKTILQAVSERVGPTVTLLTPDMSAFHFLRVYAPAVNVFSVHITPEGAVGLSPGNMKNMYGTRFVSTMEDLRRLRKPLVYLVAASSFQVWEVQELLAKIPLSSVRERLSELRRRSFGGSQYVDWISEEACIRRKLLAEASEYRAYVLTVENPTALGCSK